KTSGSGDDERQTKDENAHEGSEPRCLRSRGHERGNRCGCAFINVRRPDMKRRGGDFESKAHEHHRRSREEEGGILCLTDARRDLGDVSRTGNDRTAWFSNRRGAVDERNTVKQKR